MGSKVTIARVIFWRLISTLGLLLILPTTTVGRLFLLLSRICHWIGNWQIRRLYYPAVQERRRARGQELYQPHDAMLGIPSPTAAVALVPELTTCTTCHGKYVRWPDDMKICPECHMPVCPSCGESHGAAE